MEAPSIGVLLLPVLVWAAAGAALALALRSTAPASLVHRLGAVFVGLWALLATTALVWVLLNGGLAALEGLLARPPVIFTPAAAFIWALGAAGALAVLGVAFAFNQLVGRGFLRLYRSEPLAWPGSIASAAGPTRLFVADLPHPDAFSFTLVRFGRWRFRREEVVVIARSLRARLEPAEEAAVLAHEIGHVRELDGRYLTFLRTFSQLMRWDPVLGYLAGRLSRREEMQADADAVQLTRQPLALARALYKAIDGQRRSPSPRAAAGFLGIGGKRGRELAMERIRHLIDLSESGVFPEERGG